MPIEVIADLSTEIYTGRYLVRAGEQFWLVCITNGRGNLRVLPTASYRRGRLVSNAGPVISVAALSGIVRNRGQIVSELCHKDPVIRARGWSQFVAFLPSSTLSKTTLAEIRRQLLPEEAPQPLGRPFDGIS